MADPPKPQPLSPGDLETPTHDSTPTFPLPDAVKVRCGELAEELDVAEREGYIEADLRQRLLDLAEMMTPLITTAITGA